MNSGPSGPPCCIANPFLQDMSGASHWIGKGPAHCAYRWMMLIYVELCWYVWYCLIVFAAFTLKLWRSRVWAAFCWPSHPCSCMAPCQVTAWQVAADAASRAFKQNREEADVRDVARSREMRPWSYGDLTRRQCTLACQWGCSCPPVQVTKLVVYTVSWMRWGH